MKQQLIDLLQATLAQLQQENILDAGLAYTITLERTRSQEHGDFACNIAMVLAKQAKCPPRQLAEKIVDALEQPDFINKIEIAGPGFINFYLEKTTQFNVINEILSKGQQFGRHTQTKPTKILVEFVSSNPTGPLHVGHGRHAAYGDSVANLLAAAGNDVQREYYINDAGRQVSIITVSVLLRYLQLSQDNLTFPQNGYKGDYVIEIAKQLQQQYPGKFKIDCATLFSNLPLDEQPDGSGDKEAHIDALITKAKQLLGLENFQKIADFTLEKIITDMRDDLFEFNVKFDTWFSEASLLKSGAIEHAVSQLQKHNHTYEKEGALWFRATDFGDEKDRVLIRANGQTTYFASDVAYHLNKCERGFNVLLNILGSDHHGYVPRLQACIKALTNSHVELQTSLVQFVSLYRGQEKIPMSTRGGSFVTLRQLRNEVGNDNARYFYIMRKNEQALDFDLDLAKSQSNDNPVYYIQYAHARICSVFRQLAERNYQWDQTLGLANLTQLTETAEIEIARQLVRYPEIILVAANAHDPHTLAHYLRELANAFHAYYNTSQFIVEHDDLRNARLCLITGVKQVIANGLQLLGISVPEAM